METFFEDGDEDINGNGDPDLSLDSVFGSPEKLLDSQVLFDPFEEKFHLPTALINLGNR
jgi:hypothetical protein